MIQGPFRPHLEDHKLLTGVIAHFLGKEPILVPVEE